MTKSSQTSPSLNSWLKKKWQEPNALAIHYKGETDWVHLTTEHYLQKIVHFQNSLKEYKLEKNSKVAIMSSTRWEWAALDIAALAQETIVVAIYPNLTDEDVTYILNHSETDLIYVGTEKSRAQVERIQNLLNKKINVIVFDDFDHEASYVDQTQIEEFIESTKNILPTSPATIIYTSGTTGLPKGVLLNYEALYSEVNEAFTLFTISNKDCTLSFLPYAHVMGRIEHWGSLAWGYQVAYAESVDALKKNLKEIKPTFLVAVPRIFEKIYSGILTQVNASPLKKKLFQQTLATAKKVEYYRETHQSIPLPTALLYETLSKIVLAPVVQAFGGRLRFAICGGAPLSLELGSFFKNIGIRIFEGYGLTETFAAVTVNTETQWKLGTVGKPIGDTIIKFAADGEILVKSKKNLKCYYKNEQATNECLDQDGFFATGDIGELTTDGYLKITDRKKDLIKTAGGKYVAPQKLEGLLKQCPLVAQVLICGDQKKYITALVTIESISSEASLEEKKKAEAQIQEHLLFVNSQLASYESIKKINFLYETWSPDNGFLTPSLKVKRKVILAKYNELIQSMYELQSSAGD